MNIIGKVDGYVQVGMRWDDGQQRGDLFVSSWPAGPVVSIGDQLLRDAPEGACVLDVGGRRLYVLDYDMSRRATIAAIIDGPLWWLAVVRYYLSIAERRLLWTLRLWGLAHDDIVTYPSWDDVYLVRWWRR